MESRDQILIVYSSRGHIFYEELARRLAVACEENWQGARFRAAETLTDLEEEELESTTLAVVNPSECSYWVGDKDGFFSRLFAARKRIMVLAEAVETKWFSNQFKLPVSFHALVDVGFISQEEKLPEDFGIPYHFLFNAPTGQEKERITRADFSRKRPIPWAVVGHRPAERIGLVEELMEKLDPGGFVFLPNPGIWVREGHGTISPSNLVSVLKKTKYYVWNTHHEFIYYESFRFIDALLGGAVPVKIDEFDWEKTKIPGVFPSVESFAGAARKKGFEGMREEAREFYLSHGLLADHIGEVLEGV